MAGIVGAGGNAGAVVAGFLFKGSMSWPDAFLVMGGAVLGISFCALAVRFSSVEEEKAIEEQKKLEREWSGVPETV